MLREALLLLLLLPMMLLIMRLRVSAAAAVDGACLPRESRATRASIRGIALALVQRLHHWLPGWSWRGSW